MSPILQQILRCLLGTLAIMAATIASSRAEQRPVVTTGAGESPINAFTKLNANDAELYRLMRQVQDVLATKTVSSDVVAAVAGRAPLFSPTFTGTVTIPNLRLSGAGSTGDISSMSVMDAGIVRPVGEMVAALPGFGASIGATGVPGLDAKNGWFVYERPTSFTANAALRAQRDVRATGGVAGATYKAIWGLTNTHSSDPGFEWAVTGELHNRTLAATNAEHVAVNGTAFKHAVDGGESSKTWGGNFVCDDQSGLANPTSSCTGTEIDVFTTASGGDPNKQRIGAHVVARSRPPSLGAHFHYGLLMETGPTDLINRGFMLRGDYDIGLDATSGMFGTAPIFLGAGQRIVLDGQPTGAYGRHLRYEGGALTYQTPSGPALSVSDSGGVAARSITGQSGSGILTGLFQLDRDPTVSDIPASQCADWSNTAAGTLKRVCNLAGTLRSFAYP